MNDEREVSPSMLCKDVFIVTAIPLCNVCIHSGEPGECNILGKRPMDLRRSKHRHCEYAIIDTECFSFPRFSELYPEDTERLLKKSKKIYLKEEDASLGFLCPEYAEVTGEPLCNVCMSWNGPGKCKILGTSPDEYRWVEKRDCPHAVLDTNAIGIQIFTKLYPEDTERLLKKQEESSNEKS